MKMSDFCKLFFIIFLAVLTVTWGDMPTYQSDSVTRSGSDVPDTVLAGRVDLWPVGRVNLSQHVFDFILASS